MTVITCTRCGQDKPTSEFYRVRREKKGRARWRPECKACGSSLTKGYRDKQRAKVKPDQRFCRGCGKWKALMCFGNGHGCPDGLRARCGQCNYRSKAGIDPLGVIPPYSLGDAFRRKETTHAEEVAVTKAIRAMVDGDGIPDRFIQALWWVHMDGCRRGAALSAIVIEAADALQAERFSLEDLPDTPMEEAA